MDTRDQNSAASVGGAPSNPHRRRFASAGVKASGVILTLTSGSAMACVCKSPSGSMSGSLQSSHGNQVVACSGVAPLYWKNWPSQWPAGCYPDTTSNHSATLFSSVFPFGATTTYQSVSMMDVLKNTDSSQDPYDMGKHFVAAYLNVMSGKINFMTVTSLKGMWHDVYTYGYYMPRGDTKWYAADVAKYLASTEN